MNLSETLSTPPQLLTNVSFFDMMMSIAIGSIIVFCLIATARVIFAKPGNTKNPD